MLPRGDYAFYDGAAFFVKARRVGADGVEIEFLFGSGVFVVGVSENEGFSGMGWFGGEDKEQGCRENSEAVVLRESHFIHLILEDFSMFEPSKGLCVQSFAGIFWDCQRIFVLERLDFCGGFPFSREMAKLNGCLAVFLGCVVLVFCGLPYVHGDAEKEPPKGHYEILSKQASVILKKYRNLVILDIRTPKEFKAGYLKGAKNLNYYADDFEAKVEALDRSKTYLVHCASGGRSGKAMKLFKRKQFAAVYHMKDGYQGWTAAKLPTVRD